jgi:hypothetical protein
MELKREGKGMHSDSDINRSEDTIDSTRKNEII